MSDIEEVKEIINKSGNSFHCKVLNYLKAKGWTVLISPYYNDNISDKPREIDIIAEKAFEVRSIYDKFIGTINVKLFIECKYVPQKIVFWFYEKNMIEAGQLVTRSTPLRNVDNTYTQKHRYLSSNRRVAKLFASKGERGEEKEIIYKAINQSLNAMVYFKNEGSILPHEIRREGIPSRGVNYPVIICNSFSNFYKVDIEPETEPSLITDNFQLEVNYAYTDRDKNQNNEYFLIDVVDFEKIDRFLDSLQSDVNAFSEVLRDSPRNR